MMQAHDLADAGGGERSMPPLGQQDVLGFLAARPKAIPVTPHKTDNRYQSLFDNNIDAVFALDRNGRFTEANAAAERLSGYSQEQLRSMTFADLWTLEDSHKAMFFYARAMAGAPRSVELGAVCRDGSCMDLFITGAPILSDGNVAGLFCIARDVTRRRRAEAQLRRARREAEQAKDRFLAVISHELRTPLMPVLTTVQMLERRPDLSADMQDNLAMMRRNLELEARLIDDLLDLNRIRHGKLALSFQNVDLHAKIRSVVELCRSELADKGLSLKLDLSAAQTHMAADPARIRQMLWNIIGNAVKFTPANGSITIRTCNGVRAVASCDGDCGGGKPTCRRCEPSMKHGQFVAIHVTDTGIGITPAVMAKLFEAFGRGEHEGRSASGRGIGLAITRALVELHGGQLVVHSNGRGKGSTFSVVLPLRHVCVLPGEGKHGGRQAQGAAEGKRVLLVEDHADTARVLSRLLSDAGLCVTVASCVEAAREASDRQQFDMLISDIGLPDGSGTDVVRHIRRQRPIPAIALSGYGMDEDIRRSREAGFAEHLVKPINISQLQQTIRRLLTVE